MDAVYILPYPALESLESHVTVGLALLTPVVLQSASVSNAVFDFGASMPVIATDGMDTVETSHWA